MQQGSNSGTGLEGSPVRKLTYPKSLRRCRLSGGNARSPKNLKNFVSSDG